jgi:hypothetical protein
MESAFLTRRGKKITTNAVAQRAWRYHLSQPNLQPGINFQTKMLLHHVVHYVGQIIANKKPAA